VPAALTTVEAAGGLTTHAGAEYDTLARAAAIERRNIVLAYRESAVVGVISAASTFLPVFVARLGGSNFDVGLVTALPSVTGVILAVPIGGLIQSRRNIVPWYARGRLGSQLGYVAIAGSVLALPAAFQVSGVLGIWAVATLFSTVTSVSFPVVMDLTAGGRGRYELMSRRWSILGLANAIALLVVGETLGWLPFPANYEMVFAILGLLGLVGYRSASAIRVPDQTPETAPRQRWRTPLGDIVSRVRSEPDFLVYTACHFVFALGAALAVPLTTLFYVRILSASDAWIGVISTAQTLTLLVGYALWRRMSRSRGTMFVVVCATVGTALTPLALAMTHDIVISAVIAGFGGIFTAGVNLAYFDYAMSIVPKAWAITFISVDTWLVYVAGIIGPLAAALLADAIGIAEALVVAAATTFLAAVLFVVGPPRLAGSRASMVLDGPPRRARPRLFRSSRAGREDGRQPVSTTPRGDR
jgi:hypothetical protein